MSEELKKVRYKRSAQKVGGRVQFIYDWNDRITFPTHSIRRLSIFLVDQNYLISLILDMDLPFNLPWKVTYYFLLLLRFTFNAYDFAQDQLWDVLQFGSINFLAIVHKDGHMPFWPIWLHEQKITWKNYWDQLMDLLLQILVLTLCTLMVDKNSFVWI